jgi:hypothetical protein
MTNNKQQTAVDNLYNEMYKIIEFYAGDEQLAKCMVLRKLAKEMEKQITIKLYNDYENYLEEAFKHQNGGQAVILSFQEFYEETYGGNK